MRTDYHFTVIVDFPDGKSHEVAFPIAAYTAPQFRPYDRCDDRRTAAVFGGVDPQAAARIDHDRERLAQQISEALTAAILEGIKGQDLRNGYEQEKG